MQTVKPAATVPSSDKNPDEHAADDVHNSERLPKRRKTAEDASVPLASSSRAMRDESTPSASSPASNKKVPLRGRKKFLADLNEVKEICKGAYEVRGLQVRHLKSGDDEGAIECSITAVGGDHLVSLSFIVSDTSDYPSSHTFFCYSQDAHVSAPILRVIEGVPEQGSRTIEEMLKKVLLALSSKMVQQSEDFEDADSGEESEEWDDFHEQDDDNYGIAASAGLLDSSELQRDFNEVVAGGYRPGFVSLGTDDFVLSTSLPIAHLARDIPARALMAWDRRLLARTQYLTLLVSGMRGTYPVLQPDGSLNAEATTRNIALLFRVGLTAEYKPTKEHAAQAVRMFGLKQDRSPSPEPLDTLPLEVGVVDDDLPVVELEPEPEAEPEVHWHGFQSFSLSASLETLMNEYFLRVLRLRLKYGLGWAGAEALCWEAERTQTSEERLFSSMQENIREAEEEERALAQSYKLPPDPLSEPHNQLNLLLLAFTYLVRRLALCARYCIVCHSKLVTDYDALKPYVCDSKLCTYRYYSLNHGSSLEYEICAYPETVDLLVSLAYVAALGQCLEGSIPIGMGLRVQKPGSLSDVLVDFDQLNAREMCAAIVALIDRLPRIYDMKRHLEKDVESGRTKRRLKDMDRFIPDSAWLVLRWCVASCTAHIEELRSPEDRVQNIGSNWRQFRFSVGAPDAEAKFRSAVAQAQEQNANAQRFPSLYAFHGSAVENWHSIIRHGLWYKKVTNGRAYGDGVYFAKDGNVSMASYARTNSRGSWKNSTVTTMRCVALAEIVNLPSQFVSTSPFFVVAKTEWIVCRYLLVDTSAGVAGAVVPANTDIPSVPLDPAHLPTLAALRIQIPEPSHGLERIVAARRDEYTEAEYDDDDLRIFLTGDANGASGQGAPGEQMDVDADDWTHRVEWVQECIEHLMPPPVEASPMATMAVQRELRSMLTEQENARSLRELGWYMPPDLIGDNLFQWIVELHSFEAALPIAQDMEARGINSLVFEMRFPPTFPHAPPFIRILKPRFLPFIQGGGGHVTGGGSICMDLLTADGWSPIYGIPGILMQIRMAISNLDPRPARLSPSQWNNPYSMQEALEGYKRAAHTHGWKLPQGLDRLAR